MSVKVTVKIKKSDGRLFVPRKTEKRFLVRLTCLANMKSAYLKVEMAPGVGNSGDFYNKQDFIDALNQWTEDELVKHFEGGEW